MRFVVIPDALRVLRHLIDAIQRAAQPDKAHRGSDHHRCLPARKIAILRSEPAVRGRLKINIYRNARIGHTSSRKIGCSSVLGLFDLVAILADQY